MKALELLQKQLGIQALDMSALSNELQSQMALVEEFFSELEEEKHAWKPLGNPVPLPPIFAQCTLECYVKKYTGKFGDYGRIFLIAAFIKDGEVKFEYFNETSKKGEKIPGMTVDKSCIHLITQPEGQPWPVEKVKLCKKTNLITGEVKRFVSLMA